MGTARIEIVRLANKHTLYPGQIDRRNPNPLQTLSVTSSTTAAQSAAIAVQAEYQDLYARVSVSAAGRVGVGTGSTATNGGYVLAADDVIMLPVRAGDKIEVIDAA